MSEQVAEGNTLGLKYAVNATTGTVKSSETRTETEVTGHVSGGGAANTPVSGKVETKVTNYQNIFLTDEAGKDHAIELKNFLVPCTEGQDLTLFQLAKGSGDDGTCIQAFNKSTGKLYKNDKGLSAAMFPWLSFSAALVVMVLIIWNSTGSNPSFDGFERFAATFIASGIGLLVLYAVARIFAAVRGSRVLADTAYKSYLDRLRSS